MEFAYGPDLQRWYTALSEDGEDIRTTVYAGRYEKITENGITREFYYLDGTTIVVKENGIFKPYLAFTDNLGSILSVVDEGGAKVFDASYDSWGRQAVALNTIGLHRGYTGHEMLSEFGIINMNGRLYDPVLGRFFSPDNYIQLPDFAQNFNRYSYCLNNPLKYTDPSGELFGIDDAIIAFAVFNAARSMMQAAYNGENIWRAGAISILSSIASYGIGQTFGNAGGIGKELLRAGAHGVSNGVFSMLSGGNFGSGFASGAISSGMGSFAQTTKMDPGLMVLSSSAVGGVAAWVTGGDFLMGAFQGMKVGLFNHAMHNGIEVRSYHDKEGNMCGEIPEIICIASRSTSMAENALAAASAINTIIDCTGKSLKQNGGNSTVSNKFNFYFHAQGERGFYGNQHVRAAKLTKIGAVVTKGTGAVGKLLDGYKILDSIATDVRDYRNNGYTDGYNTVKATADVAGGWAGATAGLKAGAIVGAWIGAVPGAIIGGAIGGIVGSFGGSWLGTEGVDFVYGN